jgi:hypothetical protein
MGRQTSVAVAAAGLIAGLAFAVLAPAAHADDVFLANGESFEDVIATREGDRVRIRLAFGELLLPLESVERIEHARSPLDEFLERRAGLTEEGGSAQEWLELAEWARLRELEHSHREALLEAANLDPYLEGLRPGMRAIGYVLDESLDRWISYDAHMRAQGMVRSSGEWVRPEALRAAAEERRAPREERPDVEETLSRAVELLAMAELARETSRPAPQATPIYPVGYGFPVAYGGGWYLPPKGRDRVVHHPVSGHVVRHPSNDVARELLRRQPGSVVPVRVPDRGHVNRPRVGRTAPPAPYRPR